jgi:hypothetical protein
MRGLYALIFTLLTAPVSASSQSSQPASVAKPPAQQPAGACSAPEFRQFDFWIGTWVVKDLSGKEVGSNDIVRVADGCAIREQWAGSNGITGTSLNYYDKGSGKWQQDWVGGGGLILHLSGGINKLGMVLSGEREGPQGRVTDRITWTPLPDGRVRQEWGTSTDGGRSWKSVFVGFYVRR